MVGTNNLWSPKDDDEKWQILEELFSLPVEKRMEYLLKKVAEGKIQHLGTTDKTGPEIAIDLIKKGVKARSIGFKTKKDIDKK